MQIVTELELNNGTLFCLICVSVVKVETTIIDVLMTFNKTDNQSGNSPRMVLSLQPQLCRLFIHFEHFQDGSRTPGFSVVSSGG